MDDLEGTHEESLLERVHVGHRRLHLLACSVKNKPPWNLVLISVTVLDCIITSTPENSSPVVCQSTGSGGMFQMRNVRDSGTIALINNDIHNLRHICVSGKESKEWPSLQLACTCSCITAVIFKKLKLQKCSILPSREGIPGRHVSNATRSIQSSMKDCQHEAWRKNQLIFTITGCDSNRNIKDDFAFSA